MPVKDKDLFGWQPLAVLRGSFGGRNLSLSCRLLSKDACRIPDRRDARSSTGKGFASADHENPAWHEFLHDPLKNLPLKAFIKIGKDEVPAQHEMEGPFRQRQADILS